ncbi:MFS transporter [Rhodococcus pyridinivorans]|uniref:MFS transporter n=1 Tax=Rhodococcus pyridinivorans TaxID=103816 RepID=UPI000F276F9A|nr:MFS transporter [Rhodococcus pyridinivorans]
MWRSRAELTVLLLASTLGVMAGAIVMPVLEIIRGDLGIDGTAAGFIITAHGFAIAVTSPLIGRAIDRYGVRRSLGAGLILYGLAGGAGMTVSSYPLLIASRLALGIGAAAVFSGTTVALLAMARGPQQDRLMGWRTTATTAGGLVWPVLAGLLGGIHWHATFAIYLVALPLGIATLLVMPPDRAPEPDATAEQAPAGSAWALIHRYPILLSWYGLMIAAGLMLYSLAVFLPQRLAQLGIEAPIYVSLFMAAQAGAAILTGVAYSRIRAVLGYTALLRITAACWVAAFLILGIAGQPMVVFAASALFGIGNALLLPVVTVLIGETPPHSHRGQATALSGTAMFVGQFASPLVFGPFIDATAITTGYLLAAGIAAAILVVTLCTTVPDPAIDRGDADHTTDDQRTTGSGSTALALDKKVRDDPPPD